MKTGVHPNYHSQAKVTCACGASFTTGSTHPGPIRVEICSQCHPFFTGRQKFVDTRGRIERFEAKREAARQQQRKQKRRGK